MFSERKLMDGGDGREDGSEKNREAERRRVFKAYKKHFGLTDREMARTGAILDVGAGAWDYFGDYIRASKIGCRVISLDAGKFHDTSQDGIDQSDKIGEFDFGRDDLKKRFGMSREPQFDLILSHSSAPYTIANEEQHVYIDEHGVAKENLEVLRKKIEAVVESTLRYLKKGGRAMFYPVFRSEVIDFGPEAGGRRDFRAWRKILDETLQKLVRRDKGFICHVEDKETEGKIVYQRLTIMREK